MQYIDYQEYLEIGGERDATAFNRNIDRACGIVDNATYGRIKAMNDVPAEVKFLCRDIVEYLAICSESRHISSRSQSAGGVSESESYVSRSVEEQSKDIQGIIEDYLLGVTDDYGTPLLYKGAMR